MKNLALGPSCTERSGIREIVNIAFSMPDAIHLEIGQPNFDTPSHIVEATKKAVDEGFTKYTLTAGFASLRQLVVEKLEKVNQIVSQPDQIHLTAGAQGGLAAVFLSVLEGGDEILLPDPGYPNYRIALGCMPVKIVYYPVRVENGFAPDVDELASLVTSRTKMILINSPSNPTGAVYPKEVIEKIVHLCQTYDLYLLSDECYDELVFDGEHVSPASLCDDGRVISVFSFSKTYAMTGYRLGYVVSSRPVAEVLNKVLEGNIACVSSIAQKAGEAALQGPRQPLLQMLETYRRRRDLVDALLRDYGMWVSTPQGAFYSMADISRSRENSRSFARNLLEKAKVAVAPGTAFGQNANRLIRISLASSENDLREGLRRIKQMLE